MLVETFIKIIDADFFTGVPDSYLKALCSYLTDTYKEDKSHHIIAANEGNSVAIATGYYLATNKTPVVYLQNSGLGNIVNPLTSLMHEKVYSVPAIFVVGWRGEPGVHDEPQHVFQGEVTTKLLDLMEIPFFILSESTTEAEAEQTMERFRQYTKKGKPVAFVVRKNALTYTGSFCAANKNKLTREEAIGQIISYSKGDPIVCTTGKASRELFELRESNHDSHDKDFLTVGSMGHASSIALGIALQKPGVRIWCIDGDGAALMHMGAMAVIGTSSPANMIHIVINNGAHESVGGMPTAAGMINLSELARASGYQNVYRADSKTELKNVLEGVMAQEGPSFIEVMCAIGSRADLGRPTTTPFENKQGFMCNLSDR